MSRDAEAIPGPLAFGHKYMTGGAGEGSQRLRPESDFEEREQIKSDNVLPSYCEPPNPCPIGFTAADGCLEEFDNSAEFSRSYQASQTCICDHEHMFKEVFGGKPIGFAARQSRKGESENETETVYIEGASKQSREDAQKENLGGEAVSCPDKHADDLDERLQNLLNEQGLHKTLIAKKFHQKRATPMGREPSRKYSSEKLTKKLPFNNPYFLGEVLKNVVKKDGMNLWF